MPNGFDSLLGSLPETDRQALIVTLEQFASLLEAKIPAEPV